MNKAIYKATLMNGAVRTLEFEEHHAENTYGNGNYISVLRVEDGEIMAYVDMRYRTYVFETFCENYVKEYYGTNLLACEHIS